MKWSATKCFSCVKKKLGWEWERDRQTVSYLLEQWCEKPPKTLLYLIHIIDFNLSFPLRKLLILTMNGPMQTLTRTKHEVWNFLLILLMWGQVSTSVQHLAAPTVTDSERGQYSVYAALMTSSQLALCQNRNRAFMKIRSSLWWLVYFFF